MNYRSIFFILGCILTIEGVFLILPMITALIYGEEQVFAFLISIFICLAVGCVLILLKPEKLVFNVKEGFATVANPSFTLKTSFLGLSSIRMQPTARQINIETRKANTCSSPYISAVTIGSIRNTPSIVKIQPNIKKILL